MGGEMRSEPVLRRLFGGRIEKVLHDFGSRHLVEVGRVRERLPSVVTIERNRGTVTRLEV